MDYCPEGLLGPLELGLESGLESGLVLLELLELDSTLVQQALPELIQRLAPVLRAADS